MKTCSAVRETTSYVVERSEELAAKYGAQGAVLRGELDGVARVAQVLEVDALDDAAGVDVEARDDTHGNSHGTRLEATADATPIGLIRG